MIDMECPKCGSKKGYLRYIGKSNQEWVCQNCGEITRIEPKRREEEEEEEKEAKGEDKK